MTVTAVILSYNVPDKLVRCVKSLAAQPEINELIMIENFSKVEMDWAYIQIQQLCQEAGIAYVFHKPDQPISFSEGQNYGIDHAKNNVVLLMNNDAYFQHPNTLRTSVALISDKVKLVGHKILNEDKTVNHFGMYADGLTGKKGHLGRYFDADDPRLVTPIPVIAVTGACMLLEKTELRFSLKYWFENEDVDFCFEHFRAGYQIVCNPDAVIIHEESSTRGVVQKVNTEFARKQRLGGIFFKKKWRWFMLRNTTSWFWKQWGLLPHNEQVFFKNTYVDMGVGSLTVCLVIGVFGIKFLLKVAATALFFVGIKGLVTKWV